MGGLLGLTSSGPLRAILFDVDGTLIATRRLYVQAFADALEPVTGRRLAEAEIMQHRPRAERRFLGELAGPRTPETLERFYRAYEERHDRDFEGVYDGVEEVLDALRSRRVPLGLVTGKSRRSWAITRPRISLGAFSVTVLDEDVSAPKPDPGGLRLALRTLEAEPGEVAYVGDSLTDLEAAREAGVRPAAVLWSKKAEEVDEFAAESRARGARLLTRPHELLDWVG